eukprot:3071636-Amphidinium_carterae.1
MSSLADRPDLSTPSVLGYNSLFLRELDNIMPDMKIDTVGGEFGAGSYLQRVCTAYGSNGGNES